MDTITITNPTRARRWGYGYSTSPNGNGPHGIHPPSSPLYTGTLRQVQEKIRADSFLRSSGGVFMSRRWFFDGQPLHPHDVEDLIFSLECDSVWPPDVELRTFPDDDDSW